MPSAPLSFIATLGALDLYVGKDDQWVVQQGPHACDTAGLRARASLLWLPLLEQDYATVRHVLLTGLAAAVSEHAARRWAAFPVQELVLLGLAPSSSPYWVNLALAWTAHIEPGPEVLRQVQVMSLDPLMPQPIRHLAKRLFYTGES